MFRFFRSRAAVGLVGLAIAGCGVFSTEPSVRPTRAVTISVHDSLGTAVVGARVISRSETQHWEANHGVTNSDGAVTLTLPLAFTTIELDSGMGPQVPGARTAATTLDLATLPGKDPVNVALTLHTASWATGRVIIPGTTNQRAIVSRFEDLRLIAVTSDSATGAYRIDNVPLGRWHVRAELPDHAVRTIEIEVSTPGSMVSVPDIALTP